MINLQINFASLQKELPLQSCPLRLRQAQKGFCLSRKIFYFYPPLYIQTNYLYIHICNVIIRCTHFMAQGFLSHCACQAARLHCPSVITDVQQQIKAFGSLEQLSLIWTGIIGTCLDLLIDSKFAFGTSGEIIY